MTTLAIMKARIADEMMRDDLTSQIASAISDAIKYYQVKRFFFNEKDEITFSTVAAQNEYAAAANALIPNLYKIDWMTVGGDSFLGRITNETWRDLTATTASGEPCNYVYYNRVIRLYPTPSAIQTIRLSAHYKLSEPASDSEADNAWMVEAEELIRHRAKSLLFRDVEYDTEKAIVCAAAEQDAFIRLGSTSNSMTGTGLLVPTEF